MPIRTDLNISPYYDDYDITKQYHRILFRPGYAVQARELTQLQTILQNQVEQFGDNIFKEGSIIKGCNFTELSALKFVKVGDRGGYDVRSYIGGVNEQTGVETFYEIEGEITKLRALIISASFGLETNDPDLSTFYINYLNTTTDTETQADVKVFEQGEKLRLFKYTITSTENGDVTSPAEEILDDQGEPIFSVTERANHVGDSFGIESAVGIVYQKGHFLYAKPQITILSKYNNIPDGVSVGYEVKESLITPLTDGSLYDNSIGTPNQNAPGANRLKLEPILTVKTTEQAEADSTFFTLARYINGVAVQVRDVSQYNVLGEEMARRTYEESGNYIVNGFKTKVIERNGQLQAAVQPGVAYVKGYRIENKGEIFVTIDQLESTDTIVQQNQPVSFNYGSYVDISNNAVMGTLPVGTYATADLMNGASKIGTAMIRNFTPTRVYLSNIRMDSANVNFSDVTSIEGPEGSVSIVPSVRQKSNDVMVFNVGETFIKGVSDISLPVRRSQQITSISDVFTLVIPGTETLDVQNDDIVIVDGVNKNLTIQSKQKLSETQLEITLVSGQSPVASVSEPATIYYNTKISNAIQHPKLNKVLYVKASYSPSISKYSLGFPDVYQIDTILDSSGANVTSSFRLKNNQQDHYYDLSYIEYIPGRPVPATGLMTITLRAFKVNTATGQYFFTANSYPADTTPAEEESGVPTFNSSLIPTYKTSSGVNLNLRNCIDFRPHAANTVSYDSAEVIGTAPTVTTSVGTAPTFTGTFLVPALNSSATVDFEYFLNRTDIIAIDSYGKFSTIKGKPNRKSKAPTIGDDRLVIAEVYVPGYPAISSDRATLENKPELAIKTKALGNKTYTMKEIGDLDKKISKLFYYMSVSLLESATQNLNITDEIGVPRFKNGILVDPFNDLSIADVKNNEFNAAVDFTEKSLMPAVRTIPINLKYKNSSNTTLHPSTAEIDVATLETTTNVPVITQPYANSFRNCVSNFYDYRGTGFLFPEYDGAFDTVTAPSPNIEIDLATPFIEYTEALQEFVPLTSTQSTLLESRVEEIGRTTSGKGKGRTTGITTQQTDIIQDITRSLQVSEGRVNEQNLGEFVTNFNFNPFMRSREVRILMHGLRPNTRHYFFFDGRDVNDNVVAGEVPFSDSVRDVVEAGIANTSIVTSDSNGSIAAIFTIPPETFYVGDRVLTVTDVNDINTVESAGTSGGTITYRAYNFSVNKQALTLTTREPEIRVTETITQRSVVHRPVTTPIQPPEIERGGGDRGGDGNRDPLAQTFFIKSAMAQGADCIFASRIDLFFKRKSAINGVTVMLREVINGYPAPEIIPFSKVHLKPADVNISEDGSFATPVFFKAPVRLDVEKEYCVVIMPDAADPDYLAYTSKVGLNDLVSGSPVVMDWGDGVLFTSTNNRSWQSYQDEDLKFTLYRRNFAKSTGTVTLTNEDHEFLTLTNITLDFQNGETVYTLKTLDPATSNAISLSTGNTEATGTSLSSTYAVGDYVFVESGSNRDLFKIVELTTDTLTFDKPSKFTGTFDANPAVIGQIVYYNNRAPELMVLERSSANPNGSLPKFFAAEDIITGFTTGATAELASVDNIELSYMQPIIFKTNNSATDVTMTGSFIDPTDVDVPYTRSVPFNDKTVFNERGCVIYSKSNGSKAFDLNIQMTNGNNSTATPFIDIETATLLAYQYKVSSTSANTSRYVSRTIELAENLDAEDFLLYTTAYRPLNTDVKVYVKVQHASDPVAFELNDWIELEVVEGAEVYSSTSNLNDFKEFVYKLPDAEKVGGVITYSNSTGTYTGYRKFAVKIELLTNNVDGRIPIGTVPRLLDYRGIALT